MIEIIRHGDAPLYQTKCDLCGCEFRFGAEDARWYTDGIVLECPECCKQLWVVETDLIQVDRDGNKIPQQ